MWKILVTVIIFWPARLWAQTKEPQGVSRKPVQFSMREGPSVQIGKFVHMELEAKFQGDFRNFSPALPGVKMDELSRARLGLKGRVFDHFDYEVEREFRGTFGSDYPLFPWTDVYIRTRGYGPVDIKGGQFKLPFGMEQNTSAAQLDFVYRTRASDFLTPGRDKGVLMTGRLLDKWRVNYGAGVFKNDGQNAHEREAAVKSGGRTFAAHMKAEPFRKARSPLRRLQFGVAVTASNVPENQTPNGNSIRAETVAGEAFAHRMYVHGRRLRFGTETSWTRGSFAIKSEFIHVSEERKNAGIEMQDLPALISQGWYLSSTWVITGEKKTEEVRPKKDFLTGGGFGAIEIAGRYEALWFGSALNSGVPSRSPRAPNVLANGDRVVTAGVNWYLNRFSKIQINGIREILTDPRSAPIPGQNRYWTNVVRLQFQM